MHRVSASLVASLLLVASAAHPAYAQDDCGPLRLVTALDVLPNDYGMPLVPVTLNGVRKHFLVDTGAPVSVLFQGLVGELGLSTGASSLTITSINGRTSNRYTTVREFTLGRLGSANHSFMVDANGSPSDVIAENDIAGLLGQDILQNYDVDFDFAGFRFNLIDHDHCAGQVLYWAAPAVAIVPFQLNGNYHISFRVEVDGRRLSAVLDTGSSDTIMSLSAARRHFGLRENSPGMEKIGEIQGRGRTEGVYSRQFTTLTMEGLTVRNPVLTLVPDLMRPRMPTLPPIGSLIPDRSADGLPDLILGTSVLRHLHLYIAYKERKLYITGAEPQ